MEKSQNFTGPKIGSTIFTMFLFYKRDLNGREYTIDDIREKRHRKPYPSYDYTETKLGFKITDHRKGLEKFKNKINRVMKDDNLISGYIRAEREKVVMVTFGNDGIWRYLHFPEFNQYKHTLERLTKNVTVITPATKEMPLYNNINSPEKAKYERRVELYKNSSINKPAQRMSDILRAQYGHK